MKPRRLPGDGYDQMQFLPSLALSVPAVMHHGDSLEIRLGLIPPNDALKGGITFEVSDGWEHVCVDSLLACQRAVQDGALRIKHPPVLTMDEWVNTH